MKNRYRCEMDRLMPREEKLEELYAMMEGETDMKQVKWIGCRAVAVALVCFMLIATAAATAVPAIWQALTGNLGAFAPYAQNVRGAACQDQGVKVRVLSALADDQQVRFYLSVQDVEGDRLSECLTLEGEMTSGVEVSQDGTVSVFSKRGMFKLISYDPESRTALFSADTTYFEDARPSGDAQLSLTGMTTQNATIDKAFPLASVAGGELRSRPIGETDQTIFSPSDVSGLGYTDAVLPGKQVVLAPDQNPMPLEGTDDMWISSMGFASDGCFHIRLGFADGISVLKRAGFARVLCCLQQDGINSEEGSTVRQTLVPGGMDILFPLFHEEDLELLRSSSLGIFGDYMRPGLHIEGSWNIDFQVEYFPSTVLDWTGELANRQVTKVTLSPLTVTMNSNDSGLFSTTTLYAVKQDGSTVAAKPGTGSYDNIAYKTGASEPVWNAYNAWRFEEPVDTEEIVGLSLLDEVIPVN